MRQLFEEAWAMFALLAVLAMGSALVYLAWNVLGFIIIPAYF